ncbi:hypothetical protein E3N88_44801 [Mikania micrantha]|uniref:non-specific serine/threonine protein kinase n=1 Tax=Mikania micrantha TaxID=192012 RepID=A0A5N6LB02_9ASTR|nr:hypothetical protein E3N88_44801 [Mikania micrantha]
MATFVPIRPQHLSAVMVPPVTRWKLVLFRSPKIKSLKSSTFLKKAMKLTNKDRIGCGGYGTVYRLTINESTSFAVKKLRRDSTSMIEVSRENWNQWGYNHRNIVNLYGYYITPNYNLLIYELMPNGSLDTLLYALNREKPSDEAFIEEGTKLVTWFVKDKREEHYVDNRLEGYCMDEINQAFVIALMCLETEPSKRPNMLEVLKMLEKIRPDHLVSS